MFIYLLFLILLPNNIMAGEIFNAMVIEVHDGDTAKVSIEGTNEVKTIRLEDIDAPELSQDYGKESQISLSNLILKKNVKLDISDFDSRGRSIAMITTMDGLNVNLEQVKNGLAWVYRKYCRKKTMLSAESQAIISRVGLWASNNPIPPWIYRHISEMKANKKIDITCNPNKTRCDQMNSCDEAIFYFMNCSNIYLDQNDDGIPCQSLCGDW